MNTERHLTGLIRCGAAMLVVMCLLTACEEDKPDPVRSPGVPSQAKAIVDRAAVHAALLAALPENLETREALAAYIQSFASNEAEMAYAIYRWIRDNIAVDLEQLATGSIDHNTQRPPQVFAEKKAVAEGYAQLFADLAFMVELFPVRLYGFAIPVGYDSSNPRNHYQHVWNAIQLDGLWYLVDPSWATSSALDGSNDPNYNFLTDPANFVKRHFPSDPAWQLLTPPVAEDDFWASWE